MLEAIKNITGGKTQPRQENGDVEVEATLQHSLKRKRDASLLAEPRALGTLSISAESNHPNNASSSTLKPEHISQNTNEKPAGEEDAATLLQKFQADRKPDNVAEPGGAVSRSSKRPCSSISEKGTFPWMLYLLKQGKAYHPFSILPEPTRSAIERTFHNAYYSSATQTIIVSQKKHDKFFRYFKLNWVKKYEAPICMGYFIHSQSQPFERSDEQAYDRCTRARRPCVRAIEREGGPQLVFYPARDSSSTWEEPSFWMPGNGLRK
ncbi:hypothetical protein BU23DRAFT_566125 [Bimuria novae-zelandiae CBS 107.79]|uniref:Uncharacterized protein n=1 Tax=Bimuria novae-zelandiae CBS 107.79 TaxID=1447943 RepID=A0A6A5VJE0_9PLEO|nr:hypothetical protein BU23DRAFT_566125 [Bimuria novae-zelandiae CBS 107.79]